MGECADPIECKAIADLGVDMLAAGIGNIHGKYPANWPGLSFETLAAVQEKTGALPLVLHGGTGIPEDMIRKQSNLVYLRLMLTRSVSYLSQMLHVNILKLVKTLKVKDSILVNY